MNIEEEREFVEYMYNYYENESGFVDEFFTVFSDRKDKIGQKFEVIGRLDESTCDLEVLPQWTIKFENGEESQAYPEEIIKCEVEEIRRQEMFYEKRM